MITFISESRHASWLFLFMGNGVAPYIDLFMVSCGQVVCSLELEKEHSHTSIYG